MQTKLSQVVPFVANDTIKCQFTHLTTHFSLEWLAFLFRRGFVLGGTLREILDTTGYPFIIFKYNSSQWWLKGHTLRGVHTHRGGGGEYGIPPGEKGYSKIWYNFMSF